MKLFEEKLKRDVMVIKRSRQSAVFQDLFRENYWKLPYLEPVLAFCEGCDGIEGKRIFLIAEDSKSAMKAAMGALAYYQWMGGKATFRLSEEMELSLRLKLVYLAREEKERESIGNPAVQLLAPVEAHNTFFFYGLEETTDLVAKLDIILDCPAEIQFVQIRKEHLDTPWVKELMMDRECEVIKIPTLGDRYYVEVLENLLEEERYTLDENYLPQQLVKNSRKKCGTGFSEEDIAWELDQAIGRVQAKERRFVLREEDFYLGEGQIQHSLRRLSGMTGLKNMKTLAVEYAALSQEQMHNEKLINVCKHAIFKGKPGTGKTMCAKILAQTMAEYGQSSGTFIEATRTDIIGKYAGHTAPKVAGLFAQARNGVLFVDEAGFFLKNQEAGYAQEALKEFVRYMEMYQDVTVIFALYPQEVEQWLQLDSGLSSRIGRIVEFEDYSIEELLEIAESMCVDRGYQMEDGAQEIIKAYISERMNLRKENFGNAREIRKLVESTILAKCVRCFEKEIEDQQMILTMEDFENGALRLVMEEGQNKHSIGFT